MSGRWTSEIRVVESERVRQVRVADARDGRVLNYGEVLALWRDDRAFCRFYNELIADCPYLGLRWETPAVTAATLSRDFEFVLIDAPALVRQVDVAAFAEHYLDAKSVVRFLNLSGDAELIVPCPIADDSIYGHLASFVREAPDDQRCMLWQVVSQAMAERIDARPVWLSSAGAGVSWLHLRLDSRPKYYSFAPYKTGPT